MKSNCFLLFVVLVVCFVVGIVLSEGEGPCECAVFMYEKQGGWKLGDEATGDKKDCSEKVIADLSNEDKDAKKTDGSPGYVCEPLFVEVPGVTVSCDNEGKSLCKEICVSMAVAVKPKAPEMLCRLIGTSNGVMKPALFTRICDIGDTNKWVYSGLTCPQPICCKDGNILQCHTSIND